ncbi:GDSL-type esterase/lipase family protein [Vibrio sp. JC009]|uniref:GDSL-type esterase/lipase family protein n=1 Tax=Vibrio sp. JC009 TaxID=2912314 RepID=UPI0023B13FCC|nr:GDSL-type esterase/lipase family protein [Vibrio sp. JC009]WED20617.1 GDSL-type esterase/lipase family protein [Vibrio sp. JC009]
MKRFFLSVILLLVLISIGGLLGLHHLIIGVARTIVVPDITTTSDYKNRIEIIRSYPLSTDGIVLLGDSITYQFDVDKLSVKNKVVYNMGISGDTTRGVIKRLDLVNRVKPEVVFIMIGTNDLGRNIKVKEISHHFQIILDALKTDERKIIVQSVLLSNGFKRNNDKVKLLNLEIKKLAALNNVNYLDVNRVLSKNDYIIPEYTTDGLHLNDNGNDKWRILINECLKESKL